MERSTLHKLAFSTVTARSYSYHRTDRNYRYGLNINIVRGLPKQRQNLTRQSDTLEDKLNMSIWEGYVEFSGS